MATALLALVLLGMFSAMAHGARMDALAREREVTTRQALQAIEDRVMVVSTDAAYDTVIGIDESFDVALAGGDGKAFQLRAARSNPEDTIEPHASGKVGRLQVTGDLNGDGNSTNDAGFYDAKVNLALAIATVRWRGADGIDQEVVVTAMKVRP